MAYIARRIRKVHELCLRPLHKSLKFAFLLIVAEVLRFPLTTYLN